MPTLQVRLDEESFSRVKERGGSPWAREILLEALEPAEPERELHKAEPAAALATAAAGSCTRWMHHRKGVYCHACDTIPA